MTFEEYIASLGFRQMEDGRWATPDGESVLDADQLQQMYVANYQAATASPDRPLYGSGGKADGIAIGGTPYQQIGPWANNSADPATALQMEIDHLKQYGVEPIYDPKYGWIAPDVSVDPRVAAAHPEQNSDSIFDFGPILLPALFTAGVLAGPAAAGGSGVLSDAAIADIVAAEGGFSALPSAGMATEAISPLAQTALRQAAGGAIQSAVTGQDPLEGAVMGGVLGGLSSGIGSLTSGITPYPILDQMAGSAAMGGIVSGGLGGDPLQGALSGATSAGIGNVAGGLASGVTDIPVIDRALGQAGASAALSGIQGGDPLQAALGGAVSSGIKTVTGEVWNAAKGVWESAKTAIWENPYTGTQDEPQALIQTPDSYWSMTAAADTGTRTDAGPVGSIVIGGVTHYGSVGEALADKPEYSRSQIQIDDNGKILATASDGKVWIIGQINESNIEGERSRIATEQRQQVEAAEQAQQEQERQYAAEQARIAQEQAAAEAARIAGEQVAARAQAEAQAQAEASARAQARQAEAQRVAQEVAQVAPSAPSGAGDVAAFTPPAAMVPETMPVSTIGGSNGVEGALPTILLPGALAGIEGGQGTTGGLSDGNSGDTNMPLFDDLFGLDETYDPFADISQYLPSGPAQLPVIDQNYANLAIGPLTELSARDAEGNPISPPASALDTLGLKQMGYDAGLRGPELDRFVASGGTMGSTAFGGGGVGTGAGIPFGASGGAGGSAAGGAGGSSNINIYNQQLQPASDMWSLANLAKILGIGAVAAGAVGAAKDGLGGSSTTTATSATPAPSAEELELIKLNAELARRQLASIDQLQPLQKQLLEASQYDLAQQLAVSKARHAAITPEQEAALAQAEFERSKRLGPIQDQLLQQQMDIINTRGAATPEQLARTRAAADAAIAAGTGDINTQVKRGIGLISDEVANARGLRLTDTPILREATLLTDRGNDQIAGLVRAQRAAEAQANLTYPLQVNQQQSSMIQGQQTLNDAAKNFQDQLRQQANANRMAIIGQSSGTGIGLANTGNSSTALNALTSARLASGTRTQDTTQGLGLTGVGQLASGIGNLISATSRF